MGTYLCIWNTCLFQICVTTNTVLLYIGEKHRRENAASFQTSPEHPFSLIYSLMINCLFSIIRKVKEWKTKPRKSFVLKFLFYKSYDLDLLWCVKWILTALQTGTPSLQESIGSRDEATHKWPSEVTWGLKSVSSYCPAFSRSSDNMHSLSWDVFTEWKNQGCQSFSTPECTELKGQLRWKWL